MSDIVHKCSFDGTTDEGETVTIHVYQEFITSRSRGGTTRLPGMLSMRTDDGQAVNKVSDGQYNIVCTHRSDRDYIPVSTTDPKAP